jgi:hypothetical protein
MLLVPNQNILKFIVIISVALYETVNVFTCSVNKLSFDKDKILGTN